MERDIHFDAVVAIWAVNDQTAFVNASFESTEWLKEQIAEIKEQPTEHKQELSDYILSL